MAIDYFGHSTLDLAEAQRRIEHVRAARPEWFGDILLLYDAKAPGRFDDEIARAFGVDGLKSRFLLSVGDKERFSDCLADALELLYETFGTGGFVLTWGLDLIHLPRTLYPGLVLP